MSPYRSDPPTGAQDPSAQDPSAQDPSADDPSASRCTKEDDRDIIDRLATSLPPKDLQTLIASGHAIETAHAQEHLRQRAYELWDAAGRPPGDGVEFWLAAERELEAALEARE